MLSQKQLKDVCLLHDDSFKKCRYLSQDEQSPNKYYCMKKSALASTIDLEVDSFIKECKKRNVNPKQEKVPLGNNCLGYPIMRHIEQGYDKV